LLTSARVSVELFGESAHPSAYREQLDQAATAARQHGLDPEHYVGLDEARVVPFDNARDPLRVVFPDGTTHAPEDVSFILGRLRGQELIRRRLVYPAELRPALRIPNGPESQFD
jgi:hypothetical protein